MTPSTLPPAASSPALEPSGVFADGTPVTSPPIGDTPENCTEEATIRPLLKLSTREYRNTVSDLLAALGAAEVADALQAELDAIPEDSRSQLFRGLDDRISLEHVQGYLNVAVAAADAITLDPNLLSTVAGDCALQTPVSESCLLAFRDRLGPLAFRHPLTDVEKAELLQLSTTASDPDRGMRSMLIGAMISPRFVNHLEIDGAWESNTEALLRLTPYEVASRLSYTFWQSMPDADLFAAAADGSLVSEAGFRVQLDRIFNDPRTDRTLWSFWNEWLGLENFTGFELTRPGFQALAADTGLNQDTYSEMVDEIRGLTSHFTFEVPSTLNALLATDISLTPSTTLAGLYGVEPWSGSGAFPTFQGQRAGLFQRAALLVSSLEQTNPFHRGAFFKRALLCESLPSPDPAALPPGSLDIPAASRVETTRQRFEQKVADNDLCTGCHGLFSEVGYTLEAFDALGRYRESEPIFDEQSGELLAELPVNAAALLTIGGISRQVNSPAELNQLMLDAGNVEACFASQYVRFVERQVPRTPSAEACMAKEIAAAAISDARGLLGAFRMIAEYQSFFQRKVGPE